MRPYILALMLVAGFLLAPFTPGSAIEPEPPETVEVLVDACGTYDVGDFEVHTVLLLNQSLSYDDTGACITVTGQFGALFGNDHTITGNSTGTGVEVASGADVGLVELRVSGFATGFKVLSGSSAFIIRNEVTNNTMAGLIMDGEGFVVNSTFNGNGVGISAFNNDGHVHLENVEASHNQGQGMILTRESLHLSNVTALHNGQEGIDATAGFYSGADVETSHNGATGFILVIDGQNSVPGNITANNNVGHGVYVPFNGGNPRFDGLWANENQGHGLFVQRMIGSTGQVQVEGFQLNGNGGDGMHFASVEASVFDGEANGNQAGFYADLSNYVFSSLYVNGVSAQGNQIGVHVFEGNADVQGSDLSDNNDTAVLIEGTDLPLTFMYVVCSDLDGPGQAIVVDDPLNSPDLHLFANYYGPRGPQDDQFEGWQPWHIDNTFLGKPSANGCGGTQNFAHHVSHNGMSNIWSFGTPAPLERDLSGTFGEFDGAVWRFDEQSAQWILADGSEMLGGMDAVVVVQDEAAFHEEGRITAVVDYLDAVAPHAVERRVSQGWNFVAPRQVGMPFDAFTAVSILDNPTAELVEALYPFEGQSTAAFYFGMPETNWYQTEFTEEGQQVNPFAGHFVYVNSDGGIPGKVPAGATQEHFFEGTGIISYFDQFNQPI